MSVITREVFGIGILLFGEYHYMFIIRYFMNNKNYKINTIYECYLE